jgi:DNA modification methylase
MPAYYQDNDVVLYHGDCREVLPTLPAASVDAVICDPPYPCVDRAYGTWTEEEWHALMAAVLPQLRRVLKPSGSAVLVLQPSSERLGRLRPWLWDFLARVSREWNVVQDVWWWNHSILPLSGAPTVGLLRPSLKMCVWLGETDCYRNQDAVLWTESQRAVAVRLAARAGRVPAGIRTGPSGLSVNDRVINERSALRGGVTPFNVLPISNTDSHSSAGALEHGAGTPIALCEWWVRYLTPPGGTVLDPFCGSGTVLRAAKCNNRPALGIEAVEAYCRAAAGTLRQQMLPLAV